jgi:hypothetical protein
VERAGERLGIGTKHGIYIYERVVCVRARASLASLDVQVAEKASAWESRRC